MYEDFNFVMEDGSWKHFEFQSKNEGVRGMRRFRTYEAAASQQHEVPIVTYVLFSGKIKSPMTEFTEGINTYKIVPIIMQDKNAGQVLRELQRKQAQGETITKRDLAQLALCPLMGGEISQKDRIKEAYTITRTVTGVEKETVRKIEAVIYAMADKFLESVEMDEVMEGIKMTKLGQKLVDYGIAEGRTGDIIELLSEHGTVSQELQEKIKAEKEENILKSWLKAAAKAVSIEEFVKKTGL